MEQSTEMRPKQLIFNFDPSIYKMLEDLAKARKVPLEDALRDAIVLNKRLYDIQQAGATILIERNGRIREKVIDL